MSVHDSLGPWIKHRRKALGLTQEALADRIGYSLSSIRKIEIGLLRPSRSAAERFAGCLELSPDDCARFVRLARTARDAVPALETLAPQPPAPAPPAATTPLIERERETLFVRQCLERSAVRLYTLVGAPGIGKTRLALHLASVLEPLYGADIRFISLESLVDPNLVLPTIAQAVCQGTSLGDIRASLGGRPFLLILDNVEHVLPATPDLAQLLIDCPGLKLIATSRATLNLVGEQLVPVVPLGYPPLEPIPAWQRLEAYASVRLFIASARQADPAFRLTPENAPAVATICTRLEGLPLAIEIVATHILTLNWEELLERLEALVAQAQHKKASWPARQHTLWAAIEWSYQVLTPAEQRLFRRLSVWGGGCTLEAVETICDDLPAEDGDVAELLAALLDKSLLVHHATARDGEPRFRMLPLLRDFAREQLERSPEAAGVRSRHAAHYRDLVRLAHAAYRTPAEPQWMERLELDHDNLRATLRWAERHDPAMMMELCGELVRFWFVQSHFAEGRAWLAGAAAHLDGAGLATQANVRYGMGVLAYGQSDCAASIRELEASLALRRRLDDRPGVLNCLNYLGNVTSTLHQVEASQRYYAEALELAAASGDRMMRATLLLNIGILYFYEADFANARRYCADCLALHREITNPLGRGIVLNNLGLIAYYEGDLAEAGALLARSRQLADELANPSLRGHTLTNLGRVAAATGDYARAYELLLDATTLREAHGDRHAFAQTVEAWAELAAAAGQFLQALRLMNGARRLFEDVGAIITPLTARGRAAIEAAAVAALGPGCLADPGALLPPMSLRELAAHLMTAELPRLHVPPGARAAPEPDHTPA